MMTTDEMIRLRTAASAVTSPATPSPRAVINARQVARAISGVVMLVANLHGGDIARRACADLATSAAAWESRSSGELGDAIWQIAVVARGIMAISSRDDMRAALAFWASETDAAECQRVAGIAA